MNVCGAKKGAGACCLVAFFGKEGSLRPVVWLLSSRETFINTCQGKIMMSPSKRACNNEPIAALVRQVVASTSTLSSSLRQQAQHVALVFPLLTNYLKRPTRSSNYSLHHSGRYFEVKRLIFRTKSVLFELKKDTEEAHCSRKDEAWQWLSTLRLWQVPPYSW